MRAPLSIRFAVLALTVVCAACLVSCGDEQLPPLPDPPATVLGLTEGRPAEVRIPRDYNPDVQYPLVVLLHGYSTAGLLQDAYLQLSRRTLSEQFILVIPDGTIDSQDNRFWNATPTCCDRDGTGVDDEAYLRGLIEEAAANYRIDAGRVYLVGHSNGGYMAFRMACTSSDVITAFVSIAGGDFEADDACPDAQPVSLLSIHGTLDSDVPYAGEMTTNNTGLPSAHDAVRRFAARAGCDLDSPTTEPNMDLDPEIGTDETEVIAYRDGCQDGVTAELWTMVDGVHRPNFDLEFAPLILQWLKRHSR